MADTKPTIRVKDGLTATHLGNPKPTKDFIIIQMAQRPSKTAMGIEIPYDTLPPLPYGIIVRLGPDCTGGYKEGQHVLVPMYAGSVMELGTDENTYRFIREADIVGTLDVMTSKE